MIAQADCSNRRLLVPPIGSRSTVRNHKVSNHKPLWYYPSPHLPSLQFGMPIVAYGLSHKTAPIALRERVALDPDTLRLALADLRRQVNQVEEAAILSTCNRTELYCVLDQRGHDPLEAWLAQHRSIQVQELAAASYALWDDQAARHLARVASGLDSMVLGEPQIMGQLKDAYETARLAGTLGPRLERLTQHSFAVAKRVRTNTDIGRNPISVAFAAVSLAQRIFEDLSQNQALLLGAGDTIELVARHLRERGVAKIVIANRTLENARALANEVGGEAIPLADAPRYLVHSDIVISSTASPIPILGKGAVENALKKRKHRPIFMVDIAVPRDIEPEVGQLSDVYLYTIDDLTAIIEDNVRTRRRAAEQGELIVEEGVEEYLRDQRVRESQSTLTALRRQAERLRDDELERTLAELARGGDPAELIKRLANGLTNKLIHKPTIALRDAGANDRAEVIRVVKELFSLDSSRE